MKWNVCIYDLNVFDVRRLYLFHLFFLIAPNEFVRNVWNVQPFIGSSLHSYNHTNTLPLTHFTMQTKSRLLLSRKSVYLIYNINHKHLLLVFLSFDPFHRRSFSLVVFCYFFILSFRFNDSFYLQICKLFVIFRLTFTIHKPSLKLIRPIKFKNSEYYRCFRCWLFRSFFLLCFYNTFTISISISIFAFEVFISSNLHLNQNHVDSVNLSDFTVTQMKT